MTVATSEHIRQRSTLLNDLRITLPPADLSLTQDEEWCVVCVDDEWREIRFHDYDEIYTIPGLYEKIFYDILSCNSPRVVRSLLEAELSASSTPADDLRVLDLGAGNGMVGEELAEMGAEFIVGVDIVEEAAEATERDRPGLYEDYHIFDMTDLDEDERRELASHRFNALTCVAALGFGDIPTKAFTAAFNLVRPGGWIAFNIKSSFLERDDTSGFARLIQSVMADNTLEVRKMRPYQHRIGTSRQPIQYTAIVGNKRRDIGNGMLL